MDSFVSWGGVVPVSRLSWYALGSIVGCGLIIGAPFLGMVSIDMDSAMLWQLLT